MEKLSAMPQGRFYLAFAFFIWSILPHFHLLVHSHKGGTGNHVHPSFSAADLPMANRILGVPGPAALDESRGDEFTIDESNSAAATLVDPFEKSITVASDAQKKHSRRHGAPISGLIGLSWASGPPAFSPA